MQTPLQWFDTDWLMSTLKETSYQVPLNHTLNGGYHTTYNRLEDYESEPYILEGSIAPIILRQTPMSRKYKGSNERVEEYS